MDVIDPSTGTQIETYEAHTESDVTEALDRSTEAFEEWRSRPIRDREQLLAAAGEVLRENKREYAETMTQEMGKPISQAIAVHHRRNGGLEGRKVARPVGQDRVHRGGSGYTTGDPQDCRADHMSHGPLCTGSRAGLRSSTRVLRE